MASPSGFEPGPHWWEASALTTVPPLTIIHSKKESFIVVPFVFFQLRQEKIQLEQTLEQEQEYQVNKLMRKIDKLESDVTSKQTTLEQVMNVLYLSAALITNLIYYCILLSLHTVSLPQGSKLKKSSGRLLATNWRNIVARCKFLVTSSYNVNDAARSQGF